MNLEDLARGGKRIIVIRQPKGPDSAPGAGFKSRRGASASAKGGATAAAAVKQ